MKKLLSTLYVTTQGAYLSKEGQTMRAKVGDEKRLQLPIHTLSGIVCFGRVSMSPYLMGFCAENDVAVSFLSETGRFLAQVRGPVSGNVLLRRTQYRQADDSKASAEVARSCVIGKVMNSRSVVTRGLRDHGDRIDSGVLESISGKLKEALSRIKVEANLDTIRGIEGEAARIYFRAFDHLILSNKDSFRFTERSRRPPLDSVNALLSFIYTLLAHDVRSALEAVGLDPAVGFLHRDRPGRPSLALDLMEEFRPYLADRMVLNLINREQVRPEDFIKSDSGAVHMTEEARKVVLTSWQNRKQETVRHRFLEETVKIGLIFHVQAHLLARYLRGDLDAYPPFIVR